MKNRHPNAVLVLALGVLLAVLHLADLLLWCDADNLYAALRCEHPLPYTYRIVEEGHYFQQECDKYYRVSKIYKETLDGDTVVAKELVLDNHSEVMYDYGLIPKEQIR